MFGTAAFPVIPMADDSITRLIHPDYRAPAGFEALTAPIHHASTVVFKHVADMRARRWDLDDCYTYGLRGTPTTFELEHKLAALEGGERCLLAPSGLAAIAVADFACLKAGDEVLVPDNVYGPNRELAATLLADHGVGHRVYDPMRPDTLAAAIGPATRLVWMEAPGSISMEMPDVPALVAAVREREHALGAKIVTALDNTWGAGLAFRPLDHGLDISMQALTKYPSGGADVLMGALVTRDAALHTKLRFAHMRLGYGVSGDDAYLVLRGLPSMAVRYAQHDQTARTVAAWLQARPEIAALLHPAFAGSPGHAHWKRDFRGAAGLFSVVFDARYDEATIDRFVDALRLFKIGYSWGGPTSLVVPYRMRGTRAAWPHAGGLVRFNVGFETPADLITDLEQALNVAGT